MEKEKFNKHKIIRGYEKEKRIYEKVGWEQELICEYVF